MTGTLINAAAIIAGAFTGNLFKTRMPEKITDMAFQAIGLFTMFLGINMAGSTNQYLPMGFCLIAGSILGEAADLEGRLDSFGKKIQKRFSEKDSRLTEGFLTASLLYCIGSMAILGSFEEGLGGRPTILMTKSLLDGIASIALASAYGPGVGGAAIPVLVYQGALTLLASTLKGVLNQEVINLFTGTGGILLIGLSISILKIREIRVVNMVPALLLSILLGSLFL